MIRVETYAEPLANIWNGFVANAKNGHFLFDRNYMDYHADRFSDASLLVYDDEELIALLPANMSDGVCFSHQGLTFGGLILQDKHTTTSKVLASFDAILTELQKRGARRLVYKALPNIYHELPAEEDLYALFRNKARLERVDITTSIDLDARGQISSRRTRGAKKAKQAGVQVAESQDWGTFWKVLTQRLDGKYDTRPVHTVDEIEMLASRWPDNIRLHVATHEEMVLAGVVMYQTRRVAHSQYICASDTGLALGALDLLFQTLIESYKGRTKYFDFGISTEKAGTYLNEGLITQKEGFGGSGIIHATYGIDL